MLVTGGIGENFLMLLSAASLSVFGVHLINALRREAFEARQFNQYRLGERIGTGGMGEVYKAEHQLLKRPCAIKLIRPERAGDPQSLARFEREVRATARLSHPNTVEIFDFGRAEDGTLWDFLIAGGLAGGQRGQFARQSRRVVRQQLQRTS